MHKKYKGLIVYTKIHKENDLFIKFLSNTNELISGIVYGGLSKKKRNIYQIGFHLNLDVLFIINRPPSINGELCQPFVSQIINDKYKLNCLLSITSLINLSIIEGQKVDNIYEITNKFLLYMFNSHKWLSNFFIYLFQLLKIIGYEINYITGEKYKYFDVEKLVFTDKHSKDSIEFPFLMFDITNTKIDLVSTKQVFKIFEIIFTKYHLINFNLSLPNQYQLFKKLIIDRLKIL